jgi:hypothetical protein
MDARLARVALIGVSFFLLAANYRTQNFIISAATPQLAQEVGESAEHLRRELALEWLGHELPPWSDICPVEVRVAPGKPAGGETSFVFLGGVPGQWRMIVEGTRERVLDSVLPHEITHTIFATHFRQPLPRWADEGACTTVEHDVEKKKQERLLIQFLTTNRGIAFNQMFAMRDYPRDILPLYSQGYSLARYLIAQGGKRKFVDYVGEGLKTNNWTHATRRHYGFESLSELQITWLDWVRDGSPPLVAQAASTTQVAATDHPGTLDSAEGERPVAQVSAEVSVPGEPLADATPIPFQLPREIVAPPTSGWYARQRDQAVADRQQAVGGATGHSAATRSSSPMPNSQSSARPRGMESPGQIVLEWSREANVSGLDQPAPRPATTSARQATQLGDLGYRPGSTRLR